MNLPKHPLIREDLVYRKIDDDFVVYDPVGDYTAQFNFTAAYVLDLCDGTRAKDEICRDVAKAFSAPLPTVEGDVQRILGNLASMNFFVEETEVTAGGKNVDRDEVAGRS